MPNHCYRQSATQIFRCLRTRDRLAPNQLYIAWQRGICIAVHLHQSEATPRVESARCNIHILRLDLELIRVMFAVDDVDDTLQRLRKRGAQLVGEVVEYKDAYRLCYIRGPEGLLIGLAQKLS